MLRWAVIFKQPLAIWTQGSPYVQHNVRSFSSTHPSSLLTRVSATGLFPTTTARWRAVLPSISFKLTARGASSQRTLAEEGSWLLAVQWRAVFPSMSVTAISAPFTPCGQSKERERGRRERERREGGFFTLLGVNVVTGGLNYEPRL